MKPPTWFSVRAMLVTAGTIALLASSCAQVTPGASLAPGASASGDSPAPSRSSSAVHIVAIAARDEKQAWAMSDRVLLTTSDGGANWSVLKRVNVAGGRALLFVNGGLIVAGIGGASDLDVFVRVSQDSGVNWTETILPTTGQPGDVRLAAGKDLVAIEVVQTTSANASIADVYVSVKGGEFARHKLPAAGSLTVLGAEELWLAGGVLSDELWMSADAGESWTKVGLPADLGGELGIGPPIELGGAMVLPVTINGAETREDLFRSDDGGSSWQAIASLAIGGDTGQGVTAPNAVAGDRLVVLGSRGGLFSSTNDGSTEAFAPQGLPAGDTVLQFVSATAGWARVIERGCLDGKSNCYADTRMFTTGDAGQTWVESRLATDTP